MAKLTMAACTGLGTWCKRAQGRAGYDGQCGEDGAIERVLAVIGHTNRVAVEFGGGDGQTYSNTKRLADQGWRTVLLDLDPRGPGVIQAAITAENVNQTFAGQDIPQEPDLVSIDIDGNDYWVWKALDYRPRLLIIEYNALHRPEEAKTVPYDPGFVCDGTDYYGASHTLLCRLGVAKGYVPVHRTMLNILLARGDLYEGRPPPDGYRPHRGHPPDPHGRPWVHPST